MRGGANYGNALQNYAVQTLIEQCGAEAVTMDNRTKSGFPDLPQKDTSKASKLSPGYVKAYLRLRIGRKFGSKNDRDFSPAALVRSAKNRQSFLNKKKSRVQRFDTFRSKMLHDDTVSMEVGSIDASHIAEFDAFVCGSDQVWNPYYPQTSMIDFLQFAPEHQRIAIAPSIGISSLPESRKEIYRQWISSIPHLSVREDAGASIIRDLTGRQAKVLLDPTFGLTKEEWLSFAKKPKTVPQKDFVFCYFLGNLTRSYVKRIKRFAKEQGYEIVDVCDVHDLTYYDVDPQEFVWLLANAKAVFTDSFHGTAFSVNLQKPFVVFDRVEGGASMSSRITSVLKKTGLEGRHAAKISNSDIPNVDFSAAADVISTERQIMKDYLKQAIASATEE